MSENFINPVIFSITLVTVSLPSYTIIYPTNNHKVSNLERNHVYKPKSTNRMI